MGSTDIIDGWSGFKRAFERDPDGVHDVLHAGAGAGADVNELAWVIEKESGWDPRAVNPQSDARGVIQWMPKTRKALGMPDPFPETLTDQAPWVASYLSRLGAIPKGDLYLAIFYPAALGKPDDTVLFKVGTKGWKQNPGLRTGGDGPITAGSVRELGRPPGPSPGVDAPAAPRRRKTPQRGMELPPWALVVALVLLARHARLV